MGKIGNIVNTITGGLTGKTAADAATAGSGQAAAGQQQALDYLQKQNQTPEELKQASLKELGGAYGLPGFDSGVGAQLTTQAQNSPIFQALQQQIMQGLQDNENQTGASASQRGLLGSGVLNDALAKYRARAGVDTSNALSQVYQQNLGGITGLANQQTYAPDIANLFAQKGMTLGQGTAAAGQAKQQALSGLLSAGSEVGSEFAFSDIRLKEGVKFLGKIAGHNWYSWKWNDLAEKFGLSGNGEGVMAHEVEKYSPEAIGEIDGYMVVNYGCI